MNEKDVNKLVKLQKQVKKVYGENLICGISEVGVHVTQEEFKKLIDNYDGWEVRDNTIGYTGTMNIFKWHGEIWLQGVKFYTVGSTEDFELLGIPYPYSA